MSIIIGINKLFPKRYKINDNIIWETFDNNYILFYLENINFKMLNIDIC